jgi:AcrR family transcriptional regulator
VARTGRRPGATDTRGTILAAARSEFLEQGYNATTIRSVARRAEVDPALVYHYFGDKAALYIASLDLPRDPREIKEDTWSAGESPGFRLVKAFLSSWEGDPEHSGQSFVTLVQACSASPEAGRAMREFLTERVWTDASNRDEEAHWRRATISAQLIGTAWGRYIMQVEPLASATIEEIAGRVGPVIERLMGISEPDAS